MYNSYNDNIEPIGSQCNITGYDLTHVTIILQMAYRVTPPQKKKKKKGREVRLFLKHPPTHTQTHTRTHARTHTHTYIHTHTHTHTTTNNNRLSA